MSLTAQRYTFDAWMELPDDGRRYELLNGELVEVAAPTADHARIVGNLFIWLDRAEQAGWGTAIIGPAAVLLDATMRRENAPEPDVLFLRAGREDLVTSLAVEGVPDLVIEVLSPSNRERDLPGGAKWEIYQEFGVPAYWIVDPETRYVAQYAWRDGRYAPPVRIGPGEVLASPLFPGHTLASDALFAGVRQPPKPLTHPDPFALRPPGDGDESGKAGDDGGA